MCHFCNRIIDVSPDSPAAKENGIVMYRQIRDGGTDDAGNRTLKAGPGVVHFHQVCPMPTSVQAG